MRKKIIAVMMGICCFVANIQQVGASETQKAPTMVEVPGGAIIRGQIKTYDELFQFQMNYGNPDAPIKIIEYTNIGCPDNYRIQQAIQDYLLKGIENGTIYFEYRHVKHPSFQKSSEIFTRIDHIDDIHVLFDFISQYDQWVGKSLETVSAKYSLGAPSLEREIYQRMNYAEMLGRGVKSVPTFIVNGKLIEKADEIQDLDEFLERIAPFVPVQ